jgi:hypothetical protein
MVELFFYGTSLSPELWKERDESVEKPSAGYYFVVGFSTLFRSQAILFGPIIPMSKMGLRIFFSYLDYY